jgi:hypothetical protein
MKRSRKTTSGQFRLSLHREPSPNLDEVKKEELLKALAELMLEALGREPGQAHERKEQSDEPKDHA